MSTSPTRTAGPVTFEQLIALNDEMAALVRAGIPLEQGLAQIGRELPGAWAPWPRCWLSA